MNSTDERSQDEQDALQAWSLACNCELYEKDPGPARLNIGTDVEPHWVPRQEAWRGFYAMMMVDKADGDYARLTAAAAHCCAKVQRLGKWSDWIPAFRRRLAGPGSWRQRVPSAARVLLRSEREGFRDSWRRALDLCERAQLIVEDAGATSDDMARRRLLAGVQHQLILDTLGSIPGVADMTAEGLVDQLREIDQETG